jgi:hypothetical protein
MVGEEAATGKSQPLPAQALKLILVPEQQDPWAAQHLFSE